MIETPTVLPERRPALTTFRLAGERMKRTWAGCGSGRFIVSSTVVLAVNDAKGHLPVRLGLVGEKGVAASNVDQRGLGVV
jgi:hypothetical protein